MFLTDINYLQHESKTKWQFFEYHEGIDGAFLRFSVIGDYMVSVSCSWLLLGSIDCIPGMY